MMGFGRLARGIVFGGAMLAAAASAAAQGLPKLVIIFAGSTPPTAEMTASGKFASVDTIDAASATPTLATLLAYDAILAFTNVPPASPSGLGDVLADAVDAGRFVTIGTYGMSLPWAITGRIQTAGYNPLVIATNGAVSGSVTAVVPADPIFAGVSLAAVTYFNNDNFAHATLAPGATLLATDGAGINMIARSASGRVMGMNFYPAGGDYGGNNAEFYKLVANVAANSASGTPPAPPQEVPTLSEWALMAMALFVAGIAGFSLRRQTR
jgi:hypothetical protein